MERTIVAFAVGLSSLVSWSCSADAPGVTRVPGGGSGNTNTGKGGGSGSAGTPGAGGTMVPGTGGTAGVAQSGGAAGVSGSAGIGGSAAGTGGGGPADVNAVDMSAGCGMAPPGGQQLGAYTEYSVNVTGATLTAFTHPAHERAYHVWLPPNYDNTRAYRTVYIGYGCGNKYAGATATYRLMNAYQDAIYVGMNMPPDNIATNEGTCYNDDGGANSTEWEFFALMATEVQARFCSDRNRQYVAGYSSGSWVANMHSCYFAGYDPNRKFGPNISVRGTMVVTGGLPAIPPTCGGPVGGMWIHDAGDDANVIGGNIAALNRVLAVNGCTGSPQANWGAGPLNSICKEYTACPAEYPVVFCTTTGRGHDAQDDNALPAFTQYMNELNPM